MDGVILTVHNLSAAVRFGIELTDSAAGIPIEVRISGDRWDGVTPVLVIDGGGKVTQQLLVNGCGVIPAENLKAGQLIRFGLDGQNGSLRNPTVWAASEYKVRESTAGANAVPPAQNDPDLTLQLADGVSRVTNADGAGEAGMVWTATENGAGWAAPRGGGTGGSDGEPGKDGLSAYELAVQQGFSGSLDEWLDSLKGADGAPGAPGQDGAPGEPGAPGRDGEPGRDGSDYVLTNADKTEIAGMAAEMVPDYGNDVNEIKDALSHKLDINNPQTLTDEQQTALQEALGFLSTEGEVY